VVTVVALSVFLNNRCQSQFWDALAVYPGAEQTERESVFLGVQRVVYHSPDSPAEIERWYATQNAARMRDAVLSGDFRDTAQQNWWIEADAQRGGSTIMMQTACP
jgi:hypothetical protein